MLTLTFADNTALPYLAAEEKEFYWSGASRRALTVQLAPGAVSLDTLNALLGDGAKTADITLTSAPDAGESGDTVTNHYTGYVLRAELTARPVAVAAETPDAPAQTEDRVLFTLCRRTYIEEQLARLGVL